MLLPVQYRIHVLSGSHLVIVCHREPPCSGRFERDYRRPVIGLESAHIPIYSIVKLLRKMLSSVPLVDIACSKEIPVIKIIHVMKGIDRILHDIRHRHVPVHDPCYDRGIIPCISLFLNQPPQGIVRFLGCFVSYGNRLFF